MTRKYDPTEEVEVCCGCNEIVNRIGEDGISYCPGCETIVEGNTMMVSADEAGAYL